MIYCDSEYNDQRPILWCSWSDRNPVDQIDVFDLRTPEGIEKLADYIKNSNDAFASYPISAELQTLQRVGIPIDNIKVVDLMAEARMITLSYRFDKPGFNSDLASMLDQLKFICDLDVEEDAKQKKAMVNLIIGQNSWSPEEWDSIVEYCKSDIKNLGLLYNKIQAFHRRFDSEYSIKDVLRRGEYSAMCAEMDYCSKGFPVYKPYLSDIYRNKVKAKIAIVESLPQEWRACYSRNIKGSRVGEFKLDYRSLATLIQEKGWNWPTTESGSNYSVDKEVLSRLRESIPEVKPFYQARKSLTTLNSADLSTLIDNGYVKPQTFTYRASTSRNGLKPKQGYLLNLPKWMRKCITPHPGMALVSLDYSQQEIAVAAALSGDNNLKRAYNSGDIYLALGQMAGLIPEDGTKYSHASQRNIMKGLQLGLAYGKQLKGLKETLVPMMTHLEGAEAEFAVEKIYSWHKTYFKTYWDWIETEVNHSRNRRYISTLDNWRCWCNNSTRKTQLLNFPSQGNGAYMLREAVRLCYLEWKKGNLPPLLCSQHDALYFNCDEKESAEVVELARDIMIAASIATINFEVRVDSGIYTADKPYIPDGMTKDHEDLWNLVLQVNSSDNCDLL